METRTSKNQDNDEDVIYALMREEDEVEIIESSFEATKENSRANKDGSNDCKNEPITLRRMTIKFLSLVIVVGNLALFLQESQEIVVSNSVVPTVVACLAILVGSVAYRNHPVPYFVCGYFVLFQVLITATSWELPEEDESYDYTYDDAYWQDVVFVFGGGTVALCNFIAAVLTVLSRQKGGDSESTTNTSTDEHLQRPLLSSTQESLTTEAEPTTETRWKHWFSIASSTFNSLLAVSVLLILYDVYFVLVALAPFVILWSCLQTKIHFLLLGAVFRNYMLIAIVIAVLTSLWTKKYDFTFFIYGQLMPILGIVGVRKKDSVILGFVAFFQAHLVIFYPLSTILVSRQQAFASTVDSTPYVIILSLVVLSESISAALILRVSPPLPRSIRECCHDDRRLDRW
eukprot:CAMPEP_0178857992 /NCGR_PEP_ID=MMETSP0747-20121128/424_1 /TAXON_ID=913974 /ORGANISM="Nitzschia punctata, Strain CCMP561" /LENGTH=401 /DNA_ID=CAMNT_0020524253 /DNA_START=33 /DNA_END=1235 /DNA_ORIENTATION=-